MQYIKPYTYFVKKPGGMTNLMWGSLALFSTSFIPLIGQLVLLGYQSEIVDDLENDPDIADYPDFDTSRFVPYLTRSVWPLVAQLIVGVVLLGLIFISFVVGVGAWFLTKEPLVGVLVGLVLVCPLTIFGTMLSWPMMLHAQLSQQFQFGLSLRFTNEFVRKVGGQMFVTVIVHIVIAMAITMVGMLFFCVGMYPATVIGLMAQEHYMVQLYRLYLDQGGEPIGGPAETLMQDEEY
ncbi:DUF4013 domain-containing protein [Fimbriiglobus ruber]|uniref:DUF4013 domain-containing protein n=1 Tax=Fimbriiglobus ruber TaxID=1908690 RepID=A0A225D4I6_9BACT|nr:DUF4013 domain-containing protein [Fimbriiglobus ruber]OWK36511.1 hypothetical protein FRUB_09074 [Fimbriiglobus ruber]